MKPLIYLETTKPSFFYDTRTDSESKVMRRWTQEWWNERRSSFELVTSEAVIIELQAAPEPKRTKALKLISDIPLLEIPEEINDIVVFYIERKLMPRNPTGDALHVALASFYKCDFLLTWNCRNIANAEKFQHLRIVNNILGLDVPILTTPELLMGDDYENKSSY